MSQASHNDPEKYYQESLHRVPATDAYREEQREEMKPFTMLDESVRSVAGISTDAIEYTLDKCREHYHGGEEIRDSALRQELAVLVANQIPGRCKDCENWSDRVFYPTGKDCNITKKPVHDNHYCSYFTKLEA